MEMEIEGLEGDEAEAIKIMALHGSNVPDDTWSLPRGYDYDWQKLPFLGTQTCGKLQKPSYLKL
jgi:hypothetical protein